MFVASAPIERSVVTAVRTQEKSASRESLFSRGGTDKMRAKSVARGGESCTCAAAFSISGDLGNFSTALFVT